MYRNSYAVLVIIVLYNTGGQALTVSVLLLKNLGGHLVHTNGFGFLLYVLTLTRYSICFTEWTTPWQSYSRVSVLRNSSKRICHVVLVGVKGRKTRFLSLTQPHTLVRFCVVQWSKMTSRCFGTVRSTLRKNPSTSCDGDSGTSWSSPALRPRLWWRRDADALAVMSHRPCMCLFHRQLWQCTVQCLHPTFSPKLKRPRCPVGSATARPHPCPLLTLR